MKKILITTANNWGYGGVQIFLINLLSKIRIEEKAEIDIYFPGKILNEQFYHATIEKLKIGMICGDLEPDESDREQKIKKQLSDLLEKKKYDVIHANTGGMEFNYLCLLLGKKYGIKNIMIHSHNTFCDNGWKQKIKHGYFRMMFRLLADYRIGCSQEAAEWMFGKKFGSLKRDVLLNNGIELEKFRYQPCLREKIRLEMEAVYNTRIIGHVGCFNEQKNHQFLIDVFKKLSEHSEYDYRLWLFGTGKLETFIREKIQKMHLENKVMFMGNSDKINEYMQAMDLFLFPSLYEGLGIVLIEAQVSNLPIVASDGVPKEVNITEKIQFVSLREDVKKWVEVIESSFFWGGGGTQGYDRNNQKTWI